MGKDSRKETDSQVRGIPTGDLSRDQVEQLVEDDPTLAPTGPSEFAGGRRRFGSVGDSGVVGGIGFAVGSDGAGSTWLEGSGRASRV